MPARSLIALVLLFTFGITALWSGFQAPAHAAGPPSPPPSSRAPLQHQVLHGGFWRTDHGFVATIHIKNVLVTQPLTVTPVLFMADGTEFDLPAVQVAAAGVTNVAINDALAQAPPDIQSHLSTFGSADLRFSYRFSSAVIGSVQMTDASASLTFIFPFVGGMRMSMPRQQTFEGLWWKHDPGVDGFVALTNTTSATIAATVQALGSAGSAGALQQVTVSPRNTLLLKLTELINGLPGPQQQRGGLEVKFDGDSSDLVISAGLENPQEGYSANIPFVVRSTNSSSSSFEHTLASVGIMYGRQMGMMGFPEGTKFSPYAVLRNLSASNLAVDVAVMFNGGGAQNEKSLGRILLAPGETRDANLAPQIEQLQGSRNANMISLAFTYTGGAGELMVATGSVDRTGTFVFAVPPERAGPSMSRELAYWSTKDGNDTMLSLWNPTSTAEDLKLTFYLADGSAGYVLPLTLGPREVANVDIMELIMMGTPDENGRVFPAGANEGSLVISGAKSVTDRINVLASAGLFNVSTATCGPTCITCDGATDMSVNPDPIAVPIGQTAASTAIMTYSNGSTFDLTTAAQWSSDNTTIATVSGGVVTGMSPGSANITALVANVEQPGTFCQGEEIGPSGTECPTADMSASAPAKVPIPTAVEPIATTSQGNANCTAGRAGWSRNVTNQLQDQFGMPYRVSTGPLADTITYPSNNAFGITGSQTGTATPDANANFPDTYFVCTSACPASTASVSATQSWTFNGAALPHANSVVYKCNSITVDGR